MTQFNTKNQLFREVMGNGLKYKVPKFQRDYSWGEEQWEDLWQDILGSEGGSNSPHYMGYLVLQSEDNKNFDIIDGQQRLTTLSIFVLAGLYQLNDLIEKNVEKESNQKRKETLFSNFIGFTDPVSLTVENKLTLNRNNKKYFATYLCKLLKPPVSKINESEKLMGKALNYFRENIKNHFGKNLNGMKIAQLANDMAGRMGFTVMTVGDIGKAYTIFETLNARGVQLSTPDLVKNYLFSLIDEGGETHDQVIEQLEDSWSAIVDQLGNCKFSRFIRADWNSRNEFSRKEELFKKLRTGLNTSKKAQTYLGKLQENAEIYRAIHNKDDEFWRVYKNGEYNDEKLKTYIHTLSVFNIVSPHSVILSAFHKLSSSDFIKLLRYIEAISIRYNVICGLSRSPQEGIYCEAPNAMESTNPLKKAKKVFKKIYPSDQDFKRAFSRKAIKTEKKARYILYRIERYLNKSTNVDFETMSLEHICPKNPTSNWAELFENETLEESVFLLGNLTLLSKGENRDMGREVFENKKATFKKSPLEITKRCATYKKWGKESILSRGEWLGEHAQSLWFIPDF